MDEKKVAAIAAAKAREHFYGKYVSSDDLADFDLDEFIEVELGLDPATLSENDRDVIYSYCERAITIP